MNWRAPSDDAPFWESTLPFAAPSVGISVYSQCDVQESAILDASGRPIKRDPPPAPAIGFLKF